MNSIKGKNIIVVLTGGIACYKVCNLISNLTREGAEVRVVMTESATRLVGPKTLQVLSTNSVITTLWDYDYDLAHTELADWADLLVIAPATANIIAKARYGIADEIASTLILTFDRDVICVPAMNERMYNKKQTEENINWLEGQGWIVVGPVEGRLACGDVGIGRMVEVDEILFNIERALAGDNLSGLRFLITAGGTREHIDPVRFLGSPSTGKMGVALARNAKLRGAEVLLIGANILADLPEYYYDEYVEVLSCSEMADEVFSRFKDYDVVIMNSAVSDYKPTFYHDEKMKKKDEELELKLAPTVDILSEISSSRSDKQVVVGFSAETEDLVENAKKKFGKKKLDLICANLVGVEDSGFGSDMNRAVLIDGEGVEDVGTIEKAELAWFLLDKVSDILREKR